MIYPSKKYWCTLLFFLFATISLWAQAPQEDVVHLENGSIIRGRILEFEPKGKLKIEIAGGSVLVYEGIEVVKIEKQDVKQEVKQSFSSEKQPSKNKIAHIPTNKGMYFSIMGGTLAGISDFGGPSLGVSLKATAGYNFHHLIGIGGGVGIMLLGESPFIPIYANIRSHFLKTSASPFVDLNIGYGIALGQTFSPFGGSGLGLGQGQTAEGGLYLRPSIGVRFPSKKRTHVTMDFGYVIQFSKYTFWDWNNNEAFEKRTFYRPSLRVGITF